MPNKTLLSTFLISIFHQRENSTESINSLRKICFHQNTTEEKEWYGYSKQQNFLATSCLTIFLPIFCFPLIRDSGSQIVQVDTLRGFSLVNSSKTIKGFTWPARPVSTIISSENSRLASDDVCFFSPHRPGQLPRARFTMPIFWHDYVSYKFSRNASSCSYLYHIFLSDKKKLLAHFSPSECSRAIFKSFRQEKKVCDTNWYSTDWWSWDIDCVIKIWCRGKSMRNCINFFF